MDARNTVCAVVVTYFPEPSCAANLAAIAPQVDKIVVVDNGSSAKSFEPIAAAAGPLGVALVRLGANRGIAAALNVGLRFAREGGYRWLATFDQDSHAPPGMIDELRNARSAHPRPTCVPVVSACHVDPTHGFDFRCGLTQGSGPGWRAVPFVMTSGNLLDVDAVAAAGGFEESLFMDYVDIEFCLRLRQRGYQILEATNARLIHSLGSFELRRFLFMRLPVTNHAPIRRYYISRNRLILWRRYWKREPFWFLRDVWGFVYDVFAILLYEKATAGKLAMLLRGVRDGMRQISGPYLPELKV